MIERIQETLPPYFLFREDLTCDFQNKAQPPKLLPAPKPEKHGKKFKPITPMRSKIVAVEGTYWIYYKIIGKECQKAEAQIQKWKQVEVWGVSLKFNLVQ